MKNARKCLLLFLTCMMLGSGGVEALRYLMAYCFAGSTAIHKTNLEKTDGAVTTLAPS